VIELQFVLGSGLSSQLIAWWGSGYGGYSHVDSVLKDGSLIGARSDNPGGHGRGVRRRPPNYEKWKRVYRIALPCTDQQYNDWETYLISQVGDAYDEADIVGLLIGRKLSATGHWICSRLAYKALQVANKLYPSVFDSTQITPNTLLACCGSVGGIPVNPPAPTTSPTPGSGPADPCSPSC
jgi:hypothetical protein